jgi:hypothetical protein
LSSSTFTKPGGSPRGETSAWPFGVGGAEHEERRERYEIAAVAVEAVDAFPLDQIARRHMQRAQFLLAVDTGRIGHIGVSHGSHSLAGYV